MTQPLSPDDLMAFEQAGAADYRKARSAGFEVGPAFILATSFVSRGDHHIAGATRALGSPAVLRAEAKQYRETEPSAAQTCVRIVGAKFAMAELGDVLE